jgi:hypothetical protein
VCGLAAAPQAHPGRPVGAQHLLVPGQPVGEGLGHHSMGRECGVRSLRTLTPRLVHEAEPGKNKIWGSQTARFSLLQSEQPQLEYVCDYLLTSIIG